MPRKPPKGKIPKNARIPVTTPGHRGIAARLLKKPDLSRYEESLKRGTYEIPASEVEHFINDEFVMRVDSTNVRTLQYFKNTQQLQVEFKDSSLYEYDNVTVAEALHFATGASKGSLVWRLLRVLGSRTAHKKPFRKLR